LTEESRSRGMVRTTLQGQVPEALPMSQLVDFRQRGRIWHRGVFADDFVPLHGQFGVSIKGCWLPTSLCCQPVTHVGGVKLSEESSGHRAPDIFS
jgi:hypothetical protein